MRDLTSAEKKWLETEAMPSYIIYSKKDETAFCQKCKNEFNSKMLPTKKSGAKIKCPCCNKEVKIKNILYATERTEFGTAIIPCNEDGELVLRYYDVGQVYKEGWKEWHIRYDELLRETFHANGKFSVTDKKWDWNKLAYSDWKKCKLPNGQYTISYYTHRPYGVHVTLSEKNVSFYAKGITRSVKGTNMERVNFKKAFKKIEIKNRYTMWINFDFLNSGYANFVEYIFKIGVDNLAYELMDQIPYYIEPKERSIINMLGLKKETYKELLKLGSKATTQDLDRLYFITAYNLKTDGDWDVFNKYFRDELVTRHTYMSDKMKIDKFLKNLPMTLYKFGKWANSQKKFNMNHYIDYINMCVELKLDMKNDFVSMPKDLKASHDMVADMYNEMKFDITLKKYADNANEYKSDYEKIVPIKKKKYAFGKDNMKIVVPENTREIGHEGYKLRHCVAQYMPDIVADKKTILFIRNVNEIDVPFFTMEIIGDKITQCKGYRNCPRPTEVESFLKAFAKNKHLTIDKNEYFAAVM